LTPHAECYSISRTEATTCDQVSVPLISTGENPGDRLTSVVKNLQKNTDLAV